MRSPAHACLYAMPARICAPLPASVPARLRLQACIPLRTLAGEGAMRDARLRSALAKLSLCGARVLSARGLRRSRPLFVRAVSLHASPQTEGALRTRVKLRTLCGTSV